MKFYLHELDKEGIDIFRDALESESNKKGSDITDVFRHNLLQGNNAKQLSQNIRLDEDEPLPTRFDAAKYLSRELASLDSKTLSSNGLWAWLSLLFFRQVCPNKIGEVARYIPDSHNWRKYYRHLLKAPYFIYKQHERNPKPTRIVLYPPVHTVGSVAEEISSRQELIASEKVMEVASKLYLEEGSPKPKKGAGGTDDIPGSARRFAAVMQQFMLTYDLREISVDHLISELLPEEFDRFKE